MPYVWAFLIGVTSGLRALSPQAVVSWAARLGWVHLEATPLAFLGFAATPYILSALAIGELINDKLPKTPSRKAPAGFGARIVTGALCGFALATAVGALAGALGAVAGTLGGSEARARLARAFGKDLPAALLEDAVTIGAAVWILWARG
jgi:uncharacterized membrane protein